MILAIFNVVADKLNLKPEKLSVKIVLNVLLVRLVEQEKYSPKKSKELLHTLENSMKSINSKRINIIETLSQDNSALDFFMSDVIVSETNKKENIYKFTYIIQIIFSSLSMLLSELFVFSFKSAISFYITVLIIYTPVFILINREK